MPSPRRESDHAFLLIKVLNFVFFVKSANAKKRKNKRDGQVDGKTVKGRDN